MKAFIIALVLVAGTFAQTTEEVNFLWTSWKQAHNKEYENIVVEAQRFANFVKNYKFIQEWNKAGNTATLALNEFADLTAEEFGAMYANTFAIPDVADEEMEVEVNSFASKIGDIPESWDWREHGAVTPVKNQGQCGSCWAFATVASIEGLYQITGHPLTDFSEQQIVDCDKANYGCQGGWPYKALQYVQQNGLELQTDYPYTAKDGVCQYNSAKAIKNLNSGFVYVTPRNPDALKAAIYQQPVILLVEADQSVFQFYSSGVITSGCGTILNHAVTGVGYGNVSGQEAVYVKNSWGTSWGNKGYVYISTSKDYNLGLGACGILAQPQYPKRP